MTAGFVAVLMVLGIAVGFSLLFLTLSPLLGPRHPTALKGTTYECGIPPRSDTEIRFFVRFFLIALLFLLFDLEAVFLYPWVILYRGLLAGGRGAFALGELAVFLGILLAGYVYVWRKGGLEWQ